MSKKFGKILSFVLALVMVCSLLPISVMAAENDTYTVTFEPGTLCAFVADTSVPEPSYDYVTATYDGNGTFILPPPADVRLFPLNEDRMTFVGWVVKGTTEPVYSEGENVADIITSDITFVANYEENVIPGTVTYYMEPGEIASEDNQTASRGPIPTQYVTEVSLPTTDAGISSEYGWTIPNDLTFDHWVGPTGILAEGTDGRTAPFIPSDGAHYVAYWSEKTVETYTVTLYPGKIGEIDVPGEPVVDANIAPGTEYNQPAEDTFTYEGYRLAGWQYSSGELARFPIVINIDVDLYAVWADITPVNVWKVTLYPGEGAAFRDDVTGYVYEDGTLVGYAPKDIEEYNIALPSAFDRNSDGENATFLTSPDNMEFAGWKKTSPEGDEVFYGGQLITVTEDTTFTAQWREKGVGPYNLFYNAGLLASYTVDDTTVYNRNFAVSVPAGGEEVLPVNKAEIVEKFGWSIPTNYDFIGWINPDDPDNYIKTVSGLEEDVTVIAIWENTNVKEWTITFDAGGGTGEMEPVIVRTESDSYSYRLPYPDFTAPDGQIFTYWSISGMDGEFYQGDTIEIKSDVTITAHWATPMYYYLVSYEANGGTGEMAATFIPSSTISARFTVPACTFTPPEGMRFSYWTDENQRVYRVGQTVLIRSDLTLTAQWERDTSENFTMG